MGCIIPEPGFLDEVYPLVEDEVRRQIASMQALDEDGEPIDPAQVAATCLFLAQNPCITGTTICVDNGQHLVPLPRDIMFVVDDLLKKHAS